MRSIEDLIQEFNFDSLWWVYVLVAMILVVISVSAFLYKKKRSGEIKKTKDYNKPTLYLQKGVPVSKEEFCKLDPDFLDKDFVLSLYHAFAKIQEDYMEMDVLALKNEVSSKLYDIYSDNLAKFKTEGKKHMITDLAPVQSKIIRVELDGNKETVEMYLEVTCFDYILALFSSTVLAGSKTQSLQLGLELTFERDITKRTTVDRCPKCGNVLPKDTETTCPFCGALVLSDDYGWVLTNRVEVLKKTL